MGKTHPEPCVVGWPRERLRLRHQVRLHDLRLAQHLHLLLLLLLRRRRRLLLKGIDGHRGGGWSTSPPAGAAPKRVSDWEGLRWHRLRAQRHGHLIKYIAEM